jgi:hypothetical protein
MDTIMADDSIIASNTITNTTTDTMTDTATDMETAYPHVDNDPEIMSDDVLPRECRIYKLTIANQEPWSRIVQRISALNTLNSQTCTLLINGWLECSIRLHKS